MRCRSTIRPTAACVSASVAGYHVIMRMQSVLTWITGIATIIYVALTVDEIDVLCERMNCGEPAA